MEEILTVIPETLSNFLAELPCNARIEIYIEDDGLDYEVYEGTKLNLPVELLMYYGYAEIEVFDEYGNKIEGGFVNTNLSIYIRGNNDNN